MQPLVLKMTAFGPYKNSETIDFRELQSNRLFVISGNTGAGKTTIFDAICFALYGSASGSDRDNHTMLRSDFADDDTHTSVQLIFELNQRTYRIFRQLPHQKKGNKSKTGDDYEFYELRDGREVPCVDRQSVSDIDKKIEDLLGLTEDQFKQIVMLPQGEFRKLLTSKTENKEAILRRLFKTESYQEMNERLKSKKEAAEESYRRIEHTRDMYIQNIKATLPERENSLLFHIMAEGHYNTNQVIGGLKEEANFYQERIQVDDAHYKETYNAHDQKQTQFHKAQMINEQFQTLDEKRKQLEAYSKQIPVFKEKEEELQQAERTSHIIPYEQQAADWLNDEKIKQQAVKNAENAKSVADEAFKKAHDIYEQEKARQDKREEAARTLDRLQSFLPVVKDIDTKQSELNRLRNELKQASSQYEQAVSELEKKEKLLNTHEQKIGQMEAAIEELPAKEERLNEMREQHRMLQQYIQLNDKYTTLTNDLTNRRKLYEEAKAAYESREEKWLNNQANILAVHLHDGEACPVCGSLNHPDKAINEHTETTKDELEKWKADLDEKNNAYRKVEADIKACREQLDEAAEALREKKISHADAKEASLRLIEEGKQLSEEVEKLKSMRNERLKLKQTLETLQSEEKELETGNEKQKEALQSLNLTFTKQQTVFEERLRDVPEEVRVLAELEKQISAASKQKKKLEQDWEKAQTELQKAKEEQTKTISNSTNANQQFEETVFKRKEADLSFHQALTDASFTSKEKYHDAKMNPERQQELKQEIDAFKQTTETLKQQVNELTVELEDKSRTDLNALEQELVQLKEKMETAFSRRDQSRSHYQDAVKLLNEITKANDEVKIQEEKLQVVADLYDVMRGQNSQKISFERYLQIEYLEQIIDTANLRLKNVSNGQFLLMRSDRQESYGRQSGLAFDVYDAYTGQTRDVKTLSGGEKFHTSLCLALGMSDVIQSFQGNVSMKTMFIDEGFGSLDEESLHKALDALIELQKTGRTIGVISHVEELKAILPAALEVTKTKEGSSKTEFVIK